MHKDHLIRQLKPRKLTDQNWSCTRWIGLDCSGMNSRNSKNWCQKLTFFCYLTAKTAVYIVSQILKLHFFLFQVCKGHLISPAFWYIFIFTISKIYISRASAKVSTRARKVLQAISGATQDQNIRIVVEWQLQPLYENFKWYVFFLKRCISNAGYGLSLAYIICCNFWHFLKTIHFTTKNCG